MNSVGQIVRNVGARFLRWISDLQDSRTDPGAAREVGRLCEVGCGGSVGCGVTM